MQLQRFAGEFQRSPVAGGEHPSAAEKVLKLPPISTSTGTQRGRHGNVAGGILRFIARTILAESACNDFHRCRFSGCHLYVLTFPLKTASFSFTPFTNSH